MASMSVPSRDFLASAIASSTSFLWSRGPCRPGRRGSARRCRPKSRSGCGPQSRPVLLVLLGVDWRLFTRRGRPRRQTGRCGARDGVSADLLVALSVAVTFTMPLASMSKVTSICGTLAAGSRDAAQVELTEDLQVGGHSRSPCRTSISTEVWLSAAGGVETPVLRSGWWCCGRSSWS